MGTEIHQSFEEITEQSVFWTMKEMVDLLLKVYLL